MKKLLYISLFLVALFSCEKELELELPTPEEKLVVEGHIEPNAPPYVILTRTTPFFSTTSLNSLGEVFVHDADIKISDGNTTVTLDEFYLDSIPDTVFNLIEENLSTFPFTIDELRGQGFSVYASFDMLGEEKRRYDLTIFAENKLLTSSTTIPEVRPPDSLWFTPHPDPAYDTLVTLNVRYVDQAGKRNFVRYMTQRNDEFIYPPRFQSVFDDFTIFNIDGQAIEFALERGQTRFGDPEFETYSYFTRGDSVVVKWCTIDEAHFDFWSTMEFDRNQTGNPFGRPTMIKSNINGGLGIWGGYGASYQQIVAEER